MQIYYIKNMKSSNVNKNEIRQYKNSYTVFYDCLLVSGTNLNSFSDFKIETVSKTV